MCREARSCRRPERLLPRRRVHNPRAPTSPVDHQAGRSYRRDRTWGVSRLHVSIRMHRADHNAHAWLGEPLGHAHGQRMTRCQRCMLQARGKGQEAE